MVNVTHYKTSYKKKRVLKVINEMVPYRWYNVHCLSLKAQIPFRTMVRYFTQFRKMGLMEKKKNQ